MLFRHAIFIGKDKMNLIVKFTVKENRFRSWIWIDMYLNSFIKIGMKQRSLKAHCQKWMCYESGMCYCHQDFINVKGNVRCGLLTLTCSFLQPLGVTVETWHEHVRIFPELLFVEFECWNLYVKKEYSLWESLKNM